VFNFIIVPLFLKFNNSTMCCYKIMKQSLWKTNYQSSIFIHIAVTLKFIYVCVCVCVCVCIYIYIYILKNILWPLFSIRTPLLPLPICDHKGMSDSCTYAVLTSIWCLEMKRDHRSRQTKLPPA
jgi:hypothetical protein